jgi:cell division protein FtsN
MNQYQSAGRMGRDLGIPLLFQADVDTRNVSGRKLRNFATWPYQSGAFYRRVMAALEAVGRRDLDGLLLWIGGLEGTRAHHPWAVGLADQIGRTGHQVFLMGESPYEPADAMGQKTPLPDSILVRAKPLLPEAPCAVATDIEGVHVVASGRRLPPVREAKEGPWCALWTATISPENVGLSQNARSLDGVILSFQFREHDRDEVRNAAEAVAVTGIPVLGLIGVGPASRDDFAMAAPTRPQLREARHDTAPVRPADRPPGQQGAVEGILQDGKLGEATILVRPERGQPPEPVDRGAEIGFGGAGEPAETLETNPPAEFDRGGPGSSETPSSETARDPEPDYESGTDSEVVAAPELEPISELDDASPSSPEGDDKRPSGPEVGDERPSSSEAPLEPGTVLASDGPRSPRQVELLDRWMERSRKNRRVARRVLIPLLVILVWLAALALWKGSWLAQEFSGTIENPATAEDGRGLDESLPPVGESGQMAPRLESGEYVIQLASFRHEDQARAEVARLSSAEAISARIVQVDSGEGGLCYRVVTGDYSTSAEARAAAQRLRQDRNTAGIFITANGGHGSSVPLRP